MEQSHMTAPSASGGATWAARLFVVATLVVLTVPLVLTLVAPADDEAASAEKRALAPAPQVMVDGNLNPQVLSEAGDYYADHVALRTQLIDLDATIKQALFATSAVPNVVVGSEGWLYYAGELGDYQRTTPMSEQALLNAAHNLSLTQEVLESWGKRFVIAIAPNKSTLYPEHLPYYYLAGEGTSNYDRLLPLLKERGVHVVDLTSLFGDSEATWYLERDSHWTDEGAYRAFEAVRKALGRRVDATEDEAMGDVARVGDLDAMLHPASATPERQPHRDATDCYSYDNDATSVEDSYIVTTSLDEGAKGHLLMYRDSFGNSLLPPFATAYGQAVFTKLVPYDMSERACSLADDIVVERAERHLAFFATIPPYLPAPKRELKDVDESVQSATSVVMSINGPYLVVEGTLDKAVVRGEDRVFVEVTLPGQDPQAYEAFRVSESDGSGADFEGQEYQTPPYIVGDDGYRAYIKLEKDADQVPSGCQARVLVGDEGYNVAVGSASATEDRPAWHERGEP